MDSGSTRNLAIFSRKNWISLLAVDIYCELRSNRRFSSEALEREDSGEFRLSDEISNVISERLETFPFEEMVEAWWQRRTRVLSGAVRRFSRTSVRLHLAADRLMKSGAAQPWEKSRRFNARTAPLIGDAMQCSCRQFKHRHKTAWAALRPALAEYRLALGDIMITHGMSADEIKDLMRMDPQAVQKILESSISIGTIKRVREAYLADEAGS